jgi:hypothetical protein
MAVRKDDWMEGGENRREGSEKYEDTKERKEGEKGGT